MARAGAAASAVAVVVMMTALVQGSMAAIYAVGETTGWQMVDPTLPNFYQDWEHSHTPYSTTDFLEFKWIWPDSVLQVTAAAFAACNTQGPIQAWPGNGDGEITSMVFPLKDYAFHTLYFISGDVGRCLNGQKFFIDVFQ